MIDANSQFLAILTNVGRAKQANADALGIAWKITDMGVGDANPNGLADPPNPVPAATQTRLLNEWRRKPLNQLRVDPVNAAVIIAEQIIPADEGGKWIREIGLYDADGDLVAVANCAPSFKPLLSQGSGRTQVVRMNFIVSSTGNITLKIDPAVVLATREYVDSRIMEELGKLDIKQSVRAATTVNINLIGLQTIDGVALEVGDRVLVKNQYVPKNNGPYVVAVGYWARAKDADNNVEVTPNLTVAVEEGTTQADSIWQLVTDGTIVVGTTALTFKDITDGLARLFSPNFAGNPTGPTAPLFDNSKSLATTEFVARASGNYRGFTSLTAAASLTTASAGSLVTVIGSFTLTLPLASAMTYGGAIHFINIGGGVVNVECAGADSYNVGSGAHPVSIALQPGASLTVVTSPTQAAWWAFGSAQLQYAKVFGNTPPQFDNSKLLATTEFVQGALGNCKGLVVVSANTVLTPAQVGSYVTSNVGTGSVNVGLPLLSSVAAGSTFVITHSSTAMASFAVVTSGADSLVFDGLAGTASPYPMAVGEILTVVSTGAAWKVSGGNGARILKNGGAFAAQLSGTGYQKLPSGLIRQWGTVVTSVSGAVTVTMQSAFPTACLRASATMIDVVNPSIVSAEVVSASQIKVSGWSGQSVPLPRVVTIASWEAIGY